MANYSGDTLDYGYAIDYGILTIPLSRNPLLDQSFDGRLSYDYAIKPDNSEDGDATFYRAPDGTYPVYSYIIAGTYVSSPAQSASNIEYDYRIVGYRTSTPGGGPISGATTNVPRVKWSKIGAFDFEIDKTNVAGDIPLDHDGLIYKIMQLGDFVIAYTSGGITQLVPAKHGGYGKEIVSNIGILSPWSITGNKKIHFFVNKNYELCKLSMEGLEMLGFQYMMEALSTDDIVLSLDGYNETLHICNETTGYMYSILDRCMTQGPPAITSIVPFDDHIEFALSSNPYTISIPNFSMKTDLIDFGTRKFKTIDQVELGMYSEEGYSGSQLQVRTHARVHQVYNESLATTPWAYVDQDGVATLRSFGREFQFEFQCSDNDAVFSLDWIRIKGFIHDLEPRDS